MMRCCKQGRDDRPRRDAAQARRHPVRPQRHGARARQVPRPRRHVEVFPAYAETAYRAVLFGDEVEALQEFDPLTGEVLKELEHAAIWPATHYATDQVHDRARRGGDPRRAGDRAPRSWRPRASCWRPTGCASAPSSTWRCCASWASATGSRTTRGSSTAASPASGPYCLVDFFPDDFVCFIDESHQTVPQIGAMYEGDRSRKQTLVEHGFRLPSALDNRPLTFDEFMPDQPADGLRLGHARRLRAQPLAADRRADRAAHGRGRPRDRRARDQEPDRRPDERDPRAHRGGRADAGHHAHQEDVRGPDRLPAWSTACGCATCTPRSTPSSGSRSSASCAWASSTCSWG